MRLEADGACVWDAANRVLVPLDGLDRYAGHLFVLLSRRRTHRDAGRCHVGLAELGVHFHSLLPDGVFVREEVRGRVHIVKVPAPTQGEVERLVHKVAARVKRWLAQRGASRKLAAATRRRFR